MQIIESRLLINRDPNQRAFCKSLLARDIDIRRSALTFAVGRRIVPHHRKGWLRSPCPATTGRGFHLQVHRTQKTRRSDTTMDFVMARRRRGNRAYRLHPGRASSTLSPARSLLPSRPESSETTASCTCAAPPPQVVVSVFEATA
ncbi:hypothetical protein SETIT_2G008700v2 [Setaria italica]|uniref:Uncharacterized protein n=1 Tax=Setaria italica TaxID=4555 RepID=A0A368PTU4_SETIT|nr:hypothetical protein SETIT_2G008700v2 [Setaria italica]